MLQRRKREREEKRSLIGFKPDIEWQIKGGENCGGANRRCEPRKKMAIDSFYFFFRTNFAGFVSNEGGNKGKTRSSLLISPQVMRSR